MTQDAARGLRDRDDRPRRPPGGRRHDGPVPRPACTWSRRWTTSRALRSRAPEQARLRHADHAVGRRRAPRSSRRCKARFPAIRGPKKDDICYATQNRQDAVKFMAPQCDVVIVVGSPNSSNSNRLRELAEHMGAQAYMVDSADELRPEWIAGKRRVGVTAGASAPEVLVEEVIERLKALGAKSVRPLEGIPRTWCSRCRASSRRAASAPASAAPRRGSARCRWAAFDELAFAAQARAGRHHVAVQLALRQGAALREEPRRGFGSAGRCSEAASESKATAVGTVFIVVSPHPDAIGSVVGVGILRPGGGTARRALAGREGSPQPTPRAGYLALHLRARPCGPA